VCRERASQPASQTTGARRRRAVAGGVWRGRTPEAVVEDKNPLN